MSWRAVAAILIVILCMVGFSIAVFATVPLTVRVGVYENPPKIFTTPNGVVSGFWPALVNYIADKEGWRIEWVHGTWTQCLKNLSEGKIDIMPDVAFTQQRAEQYLFSNEVALLSWSEVYTRGGTGIEAPPDLAGEKIAVLKGSLNFTGPAGIKDLVAGLGISCTFVTVDNYRKAFQLVQTKQADAAVSNKDFGAQHAQKFGLHGTSIVFQPVDIRFAFTKGSSRGQYLRGKIDALMREMKQSPDSVYHKALAAYLGEQGLAPSATIPKWAKDALWIGGIVLVMFAAAVVVLRIEVRRRTAALQVSKEALKSSYARLRQALNGVIQALAAAIELRDPYTAGHQLRVMQLAVAIGTEMGLPPEKIDGIRYAALVHDIGKIAIPAGILAKPAKLTTMEYSLVQQHPKQAYDILNGVDFPWPIADIVLQHHERLDGSGYPNGLKNGEIVLEARILAVADVVEAMSSHRPYRPALGIDKALAEIEKNKGRLYDPEVVDTCLTVFEKGFSFT